MFISRHLLIWQLVLQFNSTNVPINASYFWHRWDSWSFEFIWLQSSSRPSESQVATMRFTVGGPDLLMLQKEDWGHTRPPTSTRHGSEPSLYNCLTYTPCQNSSSSSQHLAPLPHLSFHRGVNPVCLVLIFSCSSGAQYIILYWMNVSSVQSMNFFSVTPYNDSLWGKGRLVFMWL